jgi:hypothetical protein
MPIIEILPRDILEGRATETLRHIARFDACDPSGNFEAERFSHVAELANIQKEIRSLKLDWEEFYASVVYDVEIYDSGKDDELNDGE